jgi:hypothetical protein
MKIKLLYCSSLLLLVVPTYSSSTSRYFYSIIPISENKIKTIAYDDLRLQFFSDEEEPAR